MLLFYSHVIYLGTKIIFPVVDIGSPFYSHVIYLGTKIDDNRTVFKSGFTVT